ncbi:MAG: helicase HerA-like domain-containing protein, partial [Phycisphaerales bacterium JB065]
MKNEIDLGKVVGGGGITLPSSVQTITAAVLGIRGSGKTNTGAVIVEDLLHHNRQVVVADPTDVWWGLKSSKTGKKAGYGVVVAGGSHGDVPLDKGDGVALADFVVDHRVSVVLSLRHLRKNAQRQFMTDFAEQVYYRKGESDKRTPLLIAIDECDAFVPQRVGGAEARMVGAIEDIVRRGRAAGLGCLLISQRAASVNKDVLTQIEMLIAHRHTAPQDQNALKAWIDAHDTANRSAEFMKSLANLQCGQAWVWSPGWMDIFERVQIRMRRTFDSSATPKQGEVMKPTTVAEIDLAAITEKLAKTVKEARENDPKVLKARIAELEKEAKHRKPAGADQKKVNEIVAHAIKERDELWRAILKQRAIGMENALRQIGELVKHLPSAAENAAGHDASIPYIDGSQGQQVVRGAENRKLHPVAMAEGPSSEPKRLHPRKSPQDPKPTGKRTVADRILDALAWFEAVGITQPTRDQVSLVANGRGGNFNRNIKALLDDGCLTYPAEGLLQITDAGRMLAIAPEKPGTFDELCAMVRGYLKGGIQTEIFDAIVEHGEMFREDLSSCIGKTGGNFNRNVSALKTMGVLQYHT